MTAPRILWQSASPVLLEAERAGRLPKEANGGVAYEHHAVRGLQRSFEAVVDPEAVQRPGESVYAYWARMRGHAPSRADLVVKDPKAVTFGRELRDVPTVAMIHHLDYTLRESTVRHRIYMARLLARLRRADVVVTVSEYWRSELERVGCRRVEVIYNAFDPAEFDATPDAVAAFFAEHDLPTDRPLVYIGNASRIKGTAEVYEQLKDEGYTLVMSGRNNDTGVPARWFCLERPEYLLLLAACDAVVCMSRLPEGWNRVAHEAMLCGTPVIGSGIAGMGELLDGGQQTTLTDIGALPETVRHVLAHKDAFAERGRAFTRQYDARYFEDAWADLAHGLLAGVPSSL